MKRFFCLAVFAMFGGSAAAQHEMPKPVGPEFDMLKKLVGTWEMKSDMGKGTSTNKMDIGGLWLMSKVDMDMGGMKLEGHGMQSYDAKKKKFNDVWIDNMITSPIVSEGTWDAATKTITSTGDSTDPMTGKPAKHTSKVTWKDDDHFTFSMTWGDAKTPAFTIEYTRKK